MHYSTPSHHGQWMNTQQSGFYLEVLAIQNWAYFLPIHLEGVPLLLGILNHAGLKDENDLVLLHLLLTLLVMGDSAHHAPWSTFFPVCYFPELIPQFQAKCPKHCSFSPRGPQWSPMLSLSPISSASIIVAFFALFSTTCSSNSYLWEREKYMRVGLIWPSRNCIFSRSRFVVIAAVCFSL